MKICIYKMKIELILTLKFLVHIFSSITNRQIAISRVRSTKTDSSGYIFKYSVIFSFGDSNTCRFIMLTVSRDFRERTRTFQIITY